MPAVRRYRTLDDTRKALAAFLRMIENSEIEVDRGRALIHGCSTMAAIQREADLERRLEALEQAQAATPGGRR